MSGNKFNGIINIYKEKGMTSHDVVGKVRRILGMKKVGHTGTLDPNVVGVLPICVGNATKISEHLMNMGKTYIGELSFGTGTDTQDIWGAIVEKNSYIPREEDIHSLFEHLSGKTILQYPPMYSAIKVNGKKLYELAREGKTVEVKPRAVDIKELKVFNVYNNKVSFIVRCSKGTYIRTLVNDICKELNTVGALSFLIRTESGGMSVSDSITLDQLSNKIINDNTNLIRNIESSLQSYNNYIFDHNLLSKIINGVKINTELQVSDETRRIYCGDIFVGLGKIISYHDTNRLKMINVFYER